MSRIIKGDGSVDICCRDCGEFICTVKNYPGFSTALCIKCQEKHRILKEELAQQNQEGEKK